MQQRSDATKALIEELEIQLEVESKVMMVILRTNPLDIIVEGSCG